MLSFSDGLNPSGRFSSSARNRCWNSQARSVRKAASALCSTGCASSTTAPAASRTAACRETTSATAWSTANAPPRSTDSATRTPARSPCSGGANVEPGASSDSGARCDGPAITESRNARSSTLRAIGPATEVSSQPLVVGQLGTRPALGRSPTTLLKEAGLRSEPPMSLPSASGTIPDASAAAAPPLDPPADRVRSYGLRVVPNTGLKVCEPAAHSGTLVLPIVTAPAPRIRSATRSSRLGTWSERSGDPNVVRQPATSWVSLNACGSPCSGPTGSPRASRSSASAAPARARSSSSDTTALTSGFTCAIRARCSSSSSRAEISLPATAAAIDRAELYTSRSVIAVPRRPIHAPTRAPASAAAAPTATPRANDDPPPPLSRAP